MIGNDAVLVGVSRPAPDVLGFVTPVFTTAGGTHVAQRVSNGRIATFEAIELGEEFLPLGRPQLVHVGDPALYAVELEDGVSVGSLDSIAGVLRSIGTALARSLEEALCGARHDWAGVGPFALFDASDAGSNAVFQLHDSIRSGTLIAVVGSGVSVALSEGKLPAWRGLIEAGFVYGGRKGLISAKQIESWRDQLDSPDLDDLLSAADFMTRKLGGPGGDLYAAWLRKTFEHATASNASMRQAIQAIRAAGVPIATLNYDSLLEKELGLPGVTLKDTAHAMQWARGEYEGVLHLHGSWEEPAGCILGLREYWTARGDEFRDLLQRSLSSYFRLLFIGCGETFRDPNLSALIPWLREHLKAATPQHYALVRTGDAAARHADSAWHGFVEPLSYGDGFEDLPKYLSDVLFPSGMERRRSARRPAARESTLAGVLEEYRKFLIRDCGQVNMEGVHTGMDVARRFELEHLFVPMVVSRASEIAASDEPPGDRAGINVFPSMSLGKALERSRRLALLAMPGGGKTMLLKRLAVAYADRARRGLVSDGLPDLDLFPVLIRCRDWRQQIPMPLPTLLRHLPDVTGLAALGDFSEALAPMLQSGRVLLLIDGLDEIHDDSDRATFVENLEKFLEQYKSTRLVVTSREAGFNLIAPTLARFCDRMRIASLDDVTIGSLCEKWHLAMNGEGPAVRGEAQQMLQQIKSSPAIYNLAQSPLLLTMLLVVKQGAGRLPPDRVSLYGRAVEVLLDTWNIKGHRALNLKEALPQLAYIALRLTKAGQQIATKDELLGLLEEARDAVPRIQYYAKDSPNDFLRRVELRSSLLVEAGLKKEGRNVVPFYQFRHRTFQEYLAALAVVEGYYCGYTKADTILTVLEPVLVIEDWKEVVPMAAALAGKRADVLIDALVSRAEDELTRWDNTGPHWDGGPVTMSLTMCLIDEAEVDPNRLPTVLRTCLRAHRMTGRRRIDLCHLASGPYREALLEQAWLLFGELKDPLCGPLFGLLLNVAATDTERLSLSDRIKGLVQGEDVRSKVEGLLLLAEVAFRHPASPDVISEVRASLFHEDARVWTAACQAAAAYADASSNPQLTRSLRTAEVLDRCVHLRSLESRAAPQLAIQNALSALADVSRESWRPRLSAVERRALRRSLDSVTARPRIRSHRALLVLAFYARLLADETLAELFAACLDAAEPEEEGRDRRILLQLGKAGRGYLSRKDERNRRRLECFSGGLPSE